MKVSSLAIALLLLISCTPDITEEKVAFITFEKNVSHPSNPANPYDGAGALRNAMLETVLSTLPKDTSLGEIIVYIDSIADSNTEFNSHKTPSFTPLSQASLQTFLQTDATVAQTVSGLSLSTPGRASLVGFLEGLLMISSGDFEEVYDYIVTYEQGVLGSGSYTDADKALILTLTSLERYAAHYRKKPKDKDWDLLITHIAAESEGASIDIATAVLYSVGIETALHP